jgi:cell division topological specificity factor
MTLFGFLRRPKTVSSAETAKERLQILLAHERQDRSGRPEYLPLLQKDILAAVKKYVPVVSDKVQIKLQRGAEVSTLEIDIELAGPPPIGLHPLPRHRSLLPGGDLLAC